MTTQINKQIKLSVMLVGVAGFIPLIAPDLMRGVWAIPTTMMMVAATIVLVRWGGSNAWMKAWVDTEQPSLPAQDPFIAIDHFLAELDERELSYLREQMAIRDQAHDHEISESLVSVQ